MFDDTLFNDELFDDGLPDIEEIDVTDDEEDLPLELSASIASGLRASTEKEIANMGQDDPVELLRSMLPEELRNYRNSKRVYDIDDTSPIRGYISNPSNFAVSQDEIGTLESIYQKVKGIPQFVMNLPSAVSHSFMSGYASTASSRAAAEARTTGDADWRSSYDIQKEIEAREATIRSTASMKVYPAGDPSDPAQQMGMDAELEDLITSDKRLADLRADLEEVKRLEAGPIEELRDVRDRDRKYLGKMEEARREQAIAGGHQEHLKELGYDTGLGARFVTATSGLLGQQYERFTRGDATTALVAGAVTGAAVAVGVKAAPVYALASMLGINVTSASPFVAGAVTGAAAGWWAGSMSETDKAYAGQSYMELLELRDENGEALPHDFIVTASGVAGKLAALLDGTIGWVGSRMLYHLTPAQAAQREASRVAISKMINGVALDSSKRAAFMQAAKNAGSGLVGAGVRGLNEVMQEGILVGAKEGTKAYSQEQGFNYFLDAPSWKNYYNVFSDEAVNRYQSAFTEMALGSIGLGLPSGLIAARASFGEAQKTQAFVNDVKNVRNSMLTQAPETSSSPAHAQRVLNSLGFNQEVLIMGSDLVDIAKTNPELIDALGITEDDITAATNEARPTSIKLSKAMAVIKSDSDFDMLIKKLYVDKDGMNAEDAADIQKNLDKVMKNYAETANELNSEISEFNTRMKEIRSQVNEIAKAQGFDNVYADDVSQVIESFAFRSAIITGENPATFLNKLDIKNLTSMMGKRGEGFEQGINVYSEMERTLTKPGMLPKKASKADMIAAIQKHVGKFKQDELLESGLVSYIESMEADQVTNQDITDYLDMNRIQIGEIQERGSWVLQSPQEGRVEFNSLEDARAQQDSDRAWVADEAVTITTEAGRIAVETHDDLTLFEASFDADSGLWHQDVVFGDRFEYGSVDEVMARAQEIAANYREHLMPGEVVSEGRNVFSRYQTPGGENYKELLLTLPTSENERDNFYSSHWDDTPNVLMHVRFNERTDADGKRVLFVEEIQSDWHQKGRKEGYRDDPEVRAKLEAEHQEHLAVWAERRKNYETNSMMDERSRARELAWVDEKVARANQIHQENLEALTAPAPLKRTERWAMLGMKRMIQWAAENGFDKVAWLPGEQQADRYDLSKQISRVVFQDNRSTGMGRIHMSAPLTGGTLLAYNLAGKPVIDRYVSPDHLGDYIGKEAAQKLIEQKATAEGTPGSEYRQRELSGLDLKVGGEGMKGFYDKLLKNETAKYIKKFGSELGTTDVEGIQAPSFEVTPKMKEAALQGQALYQAAQAEIRGRMTPIDNKYLIEIFQAADASTLFHELGHAFLSEMDYIQQTQKDLPRKFVKDMEVLNKWLASGEKPEGMNDVVYRQERFARGLEKYLSEGIAPSTELQGAFARIKEWMKRVYATAKQSVGKGIEAAAGFELNMKPEIREIFDRMLATDAQIDHLAMTSEVVLTPQSIKDLGMTEAEQAQLRTSLKAARDNAKSQVEYEKNKWAKERNKRWRKEAQELIDNNKLYKDRKALMDNQIDLDMLEELVGKERAAEFGKKRIGMAKRGTGYSPAQAAVDLGYPSVDDMVTGQIKLPSQAEFVKDYLTNAQDAWEASQAKLEENLFAQEKMADYLESIGKIFARQMGLDNEAKSAHALKQWAANELGNTVAGKAMAVDSHLQTFRRQMKQFQKLMRGTKPDKYSQAWAALEAARKANAKAMQAREIKKEINSAAKRVSAYPNAKVKPALAFRDHVVDTLNKMGLSKKKLSGGLTPLENLTSDVMPTLVPDISPDTRAKMNGNYKTNLTANEAREVFRFIDWAQKYGVQVQEGTLSSFDGNIADVTAALTTPLNDMNPKGTPFPEASVRKNLQEIIDSLKAHKIGPLAMFRMFDGFLFGKTFGPHVEMLWGGVQKAVTRAGFRLDAIAERVKPIMEFVDQRSDDLPNGITTDNTNVIINGQKVIMPAVPALLQAEGRKWDYNKLFMLALNQGMEYNRKAVLDAYGMQQHQVDSLLTLFTDADWENVKAMAKLIDEQWAPMEATYKKVNLVPPTKLKGDPYTNTINGKTQEGWFFPIMFDSALSYRVDKNAKVDDIMNSLTSAFMPPKVKQGMMIERKGTGALPIDLSPQRLGTHMEHVVNYAEMLPIISDIDRITKQPEYRNAVINTFGRQMYDQIRPWLQKIASGDMDKVNPMTQKAASLVRSMVSVAALAGKVAVGIVQPISYLAFADKWGVLGAVTGYADFVFNIRTAIQTAKELSHLMKNRFTLIDETIGQMMKTGIYSPSKLSKLQALGTKAAMLHIGVGDAIASFPIWWQAYQEGVAQGKSKEDAAVYADTWVADTNPSTRAMDRSYLMSQKTSLWGLFNLFSGWIQKHGDEILIHYEGAKKGKVPFSKIFMFVALDVMMAPILASLLKKSVLKKEPVEPEELAVDVLSYNLAWIPLVGEGVTAAARKMTGQRFFKPGSSPMLSPIEMGWNTIADIIESKDEKDGEKALWAVAEALAFVYRIPAPRIYRELKEGYSQYRQSGWLGHLVSPRK